MRIFFLGVILGFVCFATPRDDSFKNKRSQATFASRALDDDDFNSHVECLHPKISHLCSEFVKNYEGISYVLNHFLITCDDSCGNTYSFTKQIQVTKGKEEWESVDASHAFGAYHAVAGTLIKKGRNGDQCPIQDLERMTWAAGDTSPLKEQFAGIVENVKVLGDSMETEARAHQSEFLKLPLEQTKVYFHGPFGLGTQDSEILASVVSLDYNGGDLTDQNLWTEDILSRAKNGDSQALGQMTYGCSMIFNTMSSGTVVVPKARVETSQSAPLKSFMKTHRRFGNSQMYFELLNSDEGKVEGKIYVSDDPDAPLTIKQLCGLLGGFCKEAKVQVENLVPSLELDLPMGGSFPPTLKVPIRRITPREFSDLIKKAHFIE